MKSTKFFNSSTVCKSSESFEESHIMSDSARNVLHLQWESLQIGHAFAVEDVTKFHALLRTTGASSIGFT